MNPTAVVVSSIIASVATATALVFFLTSGTGRGQPAAPDAGAAAIEQRLADVQDGQERLMARLESLERSAGDASARRVEAGGLDEAAVRAMIADAVAGLSAGGDGAMSDGVDPRQTLSQAEQLLALENLFGDEAAAIWAAAAEAGTIDEIVEQFRERARANPDNADDQARLGYALIQQLQRAGDPMTQANLASQADKSFDEALDIDESHWGARFSKAVSYSFWPPVMGKQPEAIRHFETLVRQQEGMNSRPEFAQTYLYLGNLYDQQGNAERAREIWQQGMTLFPADPELQERVTR